MLYTDISHPIEEGPTFCCANPLCLLYVLLSTSPWGIQATDTVSLLQPWQKWLQVSWVPNSSLCPSGGRRNGIFMSPCGKSTQPSAVLQGQEIVPLTRPSSASVRLEEEGSLEKEIVVSTHLTWTPTNPEAEICNCAYCYSTFLCCQYRERLVIDQAL